MVMEEGPSPQSVGREFVRQYYTLLNKAPLHLHRFYNHDSSFTHGGLGAKGREVDPVFGQQDIHRKIVELDFRDCKAKILSVDAQHTLGNGVVVQVSGELSNNGQPMRRFMQTFVLAPQSAKKYYVRNDVFRYQDEVFSDDEEGTDVEHADTEPEVKPQPPAAPYTETHEVPAVATTDLATQNMNGPTQLHEEPVTPYNGIASTPEYQSLPPQPEESPVPTATATSLETEVFPSPPAETAEPEKKPEVLPAAVETATKNVEVTPAPAVVSNEPKTYANLLKARGVPAAAPAPGIPSAAPPATATRLTSSTPPAPVATAETAAAAPAAPTTGESANNFQGGQQQRFQRQGRPPVGYSNGRPGASYRGDRDRGDRDRDERAESRNSAEENEWRQQNGEAARDRDARRHDDSFQVFVGNIPHNTPEENLKELFEQFGKVVEVRIQSKPGSRTANGLRAPNFGFVVFETVAAVEAALEKKPILLNGDHRLNVEPKRRGGPPASGYRGGNDQRGPMGRPGGGVGGGPARGGRMGPGGMAGGPPRDGGRGGMGGGQGGRGGFVNRR